MYKPLKGESMSIIPPKGLSVTQRQLLEDLDRQLRKKVANALKASGLRSAIECYKGFDRCGRHAGKRNFNPRSLRALEKVGFVEVQERSYVYAARNYPIVYLAKITPAGHAYLARH